MRVVGEPVGKWGLALLAVTGIAGVLLAVHGWSGRGSAATPALAGNSARAVAPGASHSPAPATAGPRASARAPASPASSAKAGPLLSSEPYARASYRIWPGPLSAGAKSALAGLSVRVHKVASGLSVTAGVTGQAPGPPRAYPSGARVYIVEVSFGDDSGNSDYSLGDDGLIVTNRQGRILQ